MSDNGPIIPHIYVLLLWFSFLLCYIGADSENFPGYCKWNLHSSGIVQVRGEIEPGGRGRGEVGKKIVLTGKGMLFLILEGCFKMKDCSDDSNYDLPYYFISELTLG